MGEQLSSSEESEEQARAESAADSDDEPSIDVEGANTESERASPSLSRGWLTRGQELAVASVGGTGALVAGALLSGSGSSVESLELFALVFCGLAGFVTWFLPEPKTNLRAARIGGWAAVAVVLYWLAPIRLSIVRAEHDLANGTRSEKEAAVERLVRLGHRDMSGADLREMNLSDADLTNLNLTQVDLSHSMLERALLLETDLSGSNLSGANFRGANLSSATLEGTDLGEGAEGARCDRYTQLPKSHECRHGAIAKK